MHRVLAVVVGTLVALAMLLGFSQKVSSSQNAIPAFMSPPRSYFPAQQMKVGQTLNWGISIGDLKAVTLLPSSATMPPTLELLHQTLMPSTTGLNSTCVGWPPCQNGPSYPTLPAVLHYHVRSSEYYDVVLAIKPQKPGIFLVGPLVLHWQINQGFLGQLLFEDQSESQNLHQFVLACVQVSQRNCSQVHDRIMQTLNKIKKHGRKKIPQWEYWNPVQRSFK